MRQFGLMRILALAVALSVAACSKSTETSDAPAAPSRDTPLGKAERLSQLGQHAQAIRMVEDLLAENPENADAHYMLGVFLAAKAIPTGETATLERAGRAFDAATTLKSTRPGGQALSGYVNLRAGRSQAAERALGACAQAQDPQCAALLGTLLAANPETVPKLAKLAHLKRVDAETIASSAAPLPRWPTHGDPGLYHVTTDTVAPSRVDPQEETEPLQRFDVVEVTRFEDDHAIFRDARGKESVTRKGWESLCTASGNRNPRCGCRKGARAGRDLFGVKAKPRRGRTLLNKTQAAKRARFTGRDQVLGIGLGVRVRYCEAAWTVKRFVDKSVPAEALRPFPGSADDATARTEALRSLTGALGAPMMTAVLDGKWVKGMPFFVVQIMDPRTRVRPSAVALAGGTITETYEVGAARITVVGGYVEAVDSTTPRPASAQSTPSAQPTSDAPASAAADAKGATGATQKLPEDRLFAKPPADAVACGSKAFRELESAVRAHCKGGHKRPTCELRRIFKRCEGTPPGPAVIGWVHRKDFDSKAVSVPVFAPRTSWDVFFEANAEGAWTVTRVKMQEG